MIFCYLTQEYWEKRDEEAERQVMQEVMDEEKRRMIELEQIPMSQDNVHGWDHFSEDELNEHNRPATLSELQAIEEAHIQYNAELPSASQPESMAISEHPTVELPTQPMNAAETEESQAPPIIEAPRQNPRQRHPIRLRNRSERIAKKRKFNFPPDGIGRSPSKPFSI